MTKKKIKPYEKLSLTVSNPSFNFLKNKLLLILLIVLAAYFQTLFMYFWNDDNAVIFKLQHLNEGMGNLGSGIFGFDSPYRMVIFSLIPIYYFFGINPFAFFAYGIFFYFLSATTVFLFAKSFLKDSRLSFFASLIFASGLIGAESLWRVYNSVHTSITIIYILFFSIFYNFFIAQKNIIKKTALYFLALIFFILAIQWGYVRAHGIFFITVGQELLFNFNWKYSLLRLAPFFYLSYIWYFAANVNTKHVQLLFSRIFENYEFDLLLVPINTLKNIFFPDILNFPLVLFLILFIFIVFKFRSRIVFFCLVFMMSSYLTYYLIYHDAVLNTTHRYLAVALPGLSLFIVFLLSRVFKSEKKQFIAVGLLIIMNLILINWIQFNILIDRSIPTKNFYKTLKEEVPTLNKNSIIYFDVKKNMDSINLFESFFGVGSMPNSTAIAIHYNLDRYDINLPQTFNEMVNLINEKKIEKRNIYSFFYSKDGGIKNTTKKFRDSLWGDKMTFSFDDLDNINYQFASPLKVNIKLKPTIRQNQEGIKKEVKNLETYLNYLEAKRHYYNLVAVKSDTHWQNYTIDKIIDADYSTSWMGSRGVWHDTNKENITIDLGEVRVIGGVKIKFSASDKTPTKYTYFCSNNNLNMQELKTVYFKPREHSEGRVDLIDLNSCRFIKIYIDETDQGDSPEIAEVEVIERGFQNLDFQLADNLQDNLVSLLNSDQKGLIQNYLAKNGLKVKICFITDEFDSLNDQAKSKFCQEKFAKLDEINSFELIVPQGGTVLKNIMLLPLVNVDFEISGVKGSNISFEDLN